MDDGEAMALKKLATQAANQASPVKTPRHKQIYEELHRSIESGVYGPSEKLPSEAELGARFQVSRITVAKAVQELQKQGLVTRRAGSGTYVLDRTARSGHVFGLLIPDLGRTEIFEPICHGMMRSPVASSHSLLWGHALGSVAQQEQEAEQLCQQYIAQRVAGVFFSPLEYTPRKDDANCRIVAALERARIPIVLLDRCYFPYPTRSRYDLVGIDNHRAGYLITAHLLDMGVERIAFLAKPFSAATVDARAAGWREAQWRRGVSPASGLERRGDPEDRRLIENMLREVKPQAFVCANDLTAAKLMQTLANIGISIPDEVRVVGIDDVKYAGLLPVPLTTQHQDCGDIGAAALSVMLERLTHPDLPTRDILLQTRTVVRESCGAALAVVRN